jgi:hypothetical protein
LVKTSSKIKLNLFLFVFLVVDIGILPTAPRGAVDIDYSTLITNPPFVAHIANLSFEIEDEDLRKIFGDLNVWNDSLCFRCLYLLFFV